ncbi:MAG: anthranilate phosphoribosyltransferase [Christensenellaceae bacterium]|jgi:anthranilate phosphoribosyltransferase|nr:anthranilate phosphoribosyltransferase [Christensenellaceae bacterium]
MIKEAIIKAVKKESLTYEMAEAVMCEIMRGEASPIQMSAYLTAMSIKGETIEEITASAAGMRKFCIRPLNDADALEIVGTGGDHSNSFNISTTSAFVVAAAGIPVAKHGNRAASSMCGAADVLEALGAKIDVSPKKSIEMLSEIGFCFFFAQNYHISMKYVAPIRKELAIRTIFNILGPLVNPAGAKMQLLGVHSESLVEPMAEVLSNLGVKNGLVVHGRDGLDEISIGAETLVCEIRNGKFITYSIDPKHYGFERYTKSDIKGGTPSDNALILKSVLNGGAGPKRDAVLLNSAAALYIARPNTTFDENIILAEKMIDEGHAINLLNKYIAYSNTPEHNRD